MSFSNLLAAGTARLPRRRGARLAALALTAALAACQASPLYGPGAVDPATGQAVGLAALAGRVSVVEAQDRTDQVVRNPLLFRLNAGQPVREPLYEIGLAVTGTDTAVSIQAVSGVPAASLYRISAAYTLYRLPGREVVAQGTRTATAPYDRSTQLFASQRALIDAREKAGAAVADQVLNALAPQLREELARGAAAAPAR